ncbi:ATP-dependent DNA helicase [Aquincola sp. MAHUQ-54]|uniref:ATP-dependent DNA helicase n=1 Tax=Aquincola agrisoli TaxID=3119538 RepID=A0AAW9QEH9_9BURK
MAVRALCEFTAKQGDLDLRFTPSPSAQEGIEGHATVAARRGAGYEAELALSGEHGQLRLRGRADGYDPVRRRLEEVKTYRGEFDAIPANHRALHWAQLKVYGALLCRARGLTQIELALVYFHVDTLQETPLVETHQAEALEAFLALQAGRFAGWAAQEMAHRAARDAAWQALRFPHGEFRRGQRMLAENVYRAAVRGRCLLAEAPTGIGKTVGTLFPLLKAAPGERLDKVFFLTAKGSGRQLALDALALIAGPAPQAVPLRVLELTARDKACEHPDKACHGESCPLAKGFYDRLPAARAEAVQAGPLPREALREVARRHAVCPYYLAQELVRWADVVVGDYNHFFDTSALLHGLTRAENWRVAVLVDEAHNLVERARAMYTAELDQAALQAVRRQAPAPVKRALNRLHKAWAAVNEAHPADYQALAETPDNVAATLQQAIATIADHLAEQPAGVDSELLRFFFDANHFARLLESFGEHSLFDLTRRGGGPRTQDTSVLCVRNLLPAPFLAPRWGAAHTATLFSATLAPTAFYRDLLGLPEDAVAVDVESPFEARQLAVHVARGISTRWQHREASLAPIADLIARQYAERPGNYLAFFSSFDYLHKAAALLAERHPQVPQWQQARGMDTAEREAFLARFAADGRGVGFAVLGGQFGEGIDLPGRRLIGAFIATLGLPPLNEVNERMRERMAARFGPAQGHDYTYLYPGLQKVVQAAGRVIRTTSDEGVIHLIDDRFGRPAVQRLLPRWWAG